MGNQLLVKMGGAAAAEVDFADNSGRKGTPFFEQNTPLLQMGGKFANGEAAIGNFKLVDPESELPADTFRLRPHARVTLKEDASGTNYTIARGRIAPFETGRRTNRVAGDEIEHDVTVMDSNLDLRGIPFRNGWSRPAETDIQRLEALQPAKLDGSSSTNTIHRATTNIVVDTSHLVDGSAPIDLEAHDYPAGTHVDEVLRDIAEQADKMWGVVLHHVDGVGTHMCLQYIDADDHTTNVSAVKVSDDPADWDPTHATAPVFEPHWQAGKGRITDNDFVVSGIIGIYDGTNDDPSTVFVESGDSPTEYETWVDVFNDGDSSNATVATRRANYYLRENKRPLATHRLSVLMASDQLHLLTYGQSIQIKSVVVNSGPNKDTYITRRVAQLIWEPAADGLWWAHMQIERPKRGTPPWRNKGQPKSTSPKPKPIPEPSDIDCEDLTLDDLTAVSTPNGDAESGTTNWSGGASNGTHVFAGSASYGVENAAPSVDLFYDFSGTFTAGTRYVVECYQQIGGQNTGRETTFGDIGTDDASVTSPLEQVVVGGQSWGRWRVCWTPSANRTGVQLQVHREQEPSAPPTSSDWAVVDNLQLYTVAADAEGELVGTDTDYARGDHNHRHGDLAGRNVEDQHVARAVSLAPPAGMTATNVQDGFEELAGSIDSGAETSFEHGNMGSTETVDVADGTWHRGTLDDDVTITVQGFTDDEGVVVLFGVTQDGTGGRDITWDSDVVFADDDQPAQAANSVTWFLLWSDEGDSTVYGARVGGGGITDHGDATGLGDDDHTQYLNEARHDALDHGGLPGAGGIGPLLITSEPAGSPLVFTDLLQNSEGTDLLYASEP